jgi:hypothetical protein
MLIAAEDDEALEVGIALQDDLDEGHAEGPGASGDQN